MLADHACSCAACGSTLPRVRPSSLRLAVILAGLLFAAEPWSARCESARGIFALGVANRPVAQQILQNPSVDGVSLLFHWRSLEPERRRFRWDLSDDEIARAHHHGKMVSLGVTPGIFTPEWVYAQGARKFSFRWDKPWGPPRCTPMSIPVPWDATYISEWRDFVRALARRYARNPDVVAVKIQGINAQTPELLLPHSSGNPSGPMMADCPDTDNLRAWQALGYRPEKIHSAWRDLANTYAQAFPRQLLVLETGPAGMPPIDEMGNLIPGRGADRGLTLAIISLGKGLLGNRLIIQNDGLSTSLAWPALPEIAAPAGIAYQAKWSITDDPSCRMNDSQAPCDPRTVLQRSINNGLSGGGRYIELYSVDLLNPELHDVVITAHRQFKESFLTTPERTYSSRQH